MKTDTQIRLDGMKALISCLGMIEAERFVSLIQREPFDYTKWQRGLWEGLTVREISRMAMEKCAQKKAI